jgi:DNA-binding PadR family transcriptional regulator
MVTLTPAVFHILLALAGGESHGYGIMLEVEELTRGCIRLGPGTLYRSIQRMLVQGLIEELEERGLHRRARITNGGEDVEQERSGRRSCTAT